MIWITDVTKTASFIEIYLLNLERRHFIAQLRDYQLITYTVPFFLHPDARFDYQCYFSDVWKCKALKKKKEEVSTKKDIKVSSKSG